MTVKIPEQVQRGLEEAEAIEAAMQAPEPGPAEPPADPPPPPPAPEPPAPPAENWEQRYHTLKGMFDAEVPRLNAQVKELTTQVTALTEQVNAKPPAPPAPEPKPVASAISDKDREAFGDDLVDVIQRAAQEIADKQTAPLLAEIEKLKSTTTTVSEKVTTVADAQQGDAEAKFFTEFSKLVPDWQAINVDQRFLAWCGETHPLTGAARQALLDDAFGQRDHARVAALFNQYKSDTGIAAAPATDEARAELESQIAPSAAHTTTPSTAPAEKVWTTGEVTKFYDDITKGVYRGKDAERNAIEAQIDQAIIDGRVR